MQTYVSRVKIVGDKHLASKGLAVKDYISYISKENNRGDELSLYLLCRMTQKHACVIGENLVCTPVALKIKIKTDCQIVLVYLGAGTVWDTKLVAKASKKKSPPKSNLKLPLSSGEEYSPPSTPVYDPAIKRQCTRSMGLIETESSKSSSSESEPEPELSSSHG